MTQSQTTGAGHTLILRRAPRTDLAPLGELLADPDDLARANPAAKHPFDPFEWAEKWVNELDDAIFYIIDESGREVGFFCLRAGIGPEQRHLSYVILAEEVRGGAGAALVSLILEAARDLEARVVTLKVELDNPAALAAYRNAGFEEMSTSDGLAMMRLDLG